MWRDENELNTGEFDGKIAQAIDRSKVFICCITQKYCESNNCNLEFNHAYELNKPLIPIMVDDLDTRKMHEITVRARGYQCGIGLKLG